jgi:hypothetical protein
MQLETAALLQVFPFLAENQFFIDCVCVGKNDSLSVAQ